MNIEKMTDKELGKFSGLVDRLERQYDEAQETLVEVQAKSKSRTDNTVTFTCWLLRRSFQNEDARRLKRLRKAIDQELKSRKLR